MKFTITFRCANSNSQPVSQTMGKTGLIHLDRARVEGKNPSLMAEEMAESIISLHSYGYAIIVDEMLARKSGHFSSTSDIEVIVPNKSLNAWIIEKWFTKNEENCKYKVYWKYTLNEELLLAAWEKAGFPLSWEIK